MQLFTVKPGIYQIKIDGKKYIFLKTQGQVYETFWSNWEKMTLILKQETAD